MKTGRLHQWRKQPGDAVKKGDVLAEIESDKAVMDVESFHDGYLAGPLAEAETDVPVGAVIGYIVDTPAQVAQASTGQEGAAPTPAPGPAGAGTAHPVEPPPASSPSTNRSVPPQPAPAPMAPSEVLSPAVTPALEAAKGVKATPYARGLAGELGIDLSHIPPASDGVIHASQVVAAAISGPQPDLKAGPPYTIKSLSSMARAVADNMSATLSTPTFRVSARLPLTPLKTLAHEQKQSLTLLLARACASTVKAHPRFNAAYTARGLAQRERVDVAIAVDIPDGLVTSVIRDAADRPLDELAEDWRILRDKVKRRRMVPEDYQGATFYLSNLGLFRQVTHFDAIVPLGAAAILALGAEREDGAEFTLSCDHRVVFGAEAARFLETLSAFLNNPERLAGGDPP
ncbi:Dihydrolipoamide acetyltransferase component of pyruvate dehydrogenase complex [hydrothermal vent metagenome]|uniref:Dihydrolipoamide acetyltransferase component of pyruvate dehydrogenase complex n=1 Tax=hydrothermal vent metagenome TaxID=652676 RepID=A0A3B0YQC2_9ZZZZ